MTEFFTKPTARVTSSSLLSAMHDGTEQASVQTLMIHKTALFPDPDQPRKFFDPEVIAERRVQMEQNGQLSPITVLPPVERDGRQMYQIYDGESRWRAAMLSDSIEYLRAEIDPKAADDKLTRLLGQLLHNDDGAAPLTPLEKAAAYLRVVNGFKEGGSGQPISDAAEKLGHDLADFSRVLSLNEMSPELEAFCLTNGIADVRALSGLVRFAKLGSEKDSSELLAQIERNAGAQKAGGGIPIRNLIAEALKALKTGSPRRAKSQRDKEKKTRQLAVVSVTVKGGADEAVLLVETPREVLKLKLSPSLMAALRASLAAGNSDTVNT